MSLHDIRIDKILPQKKQDNKIKIYMIKNIYDPVYLSKTRLYHGMFFVLAFFILLIFMRLILLI